MYAAETCKPYHEMPVKCACHSAKYVQQSVRLICNSSINSINFLQEMHWHCVGEKSGTPLCHLALGFDAEVVGLVAEYWDMCKTNSQGLMPIFSACKVTATQQSATVHQLGF